MGILTNNKNIQQGDVCPNPNCGLIVMMPPETHPECVFCHGKLYDEDSYYPDEVQDNDDEVLSTDDEDCVEDSDDGDIDLCDIFSRVCKAF